MLKLAADGINRRARLGVALIAGVVALLGAGVAIGATLLRAAPVKRDALARTDHARGAKDKTLGLSKVIVRPGAELALHHHPGTQIARVEHGTLTYTVVDGKAKVHEGDADAAGSLVRTIEAGETAELHSGQWIVEQPSDHHMAANRGESKVVLYLATLFRHGAPPSIPG